jgi:hypothetical protein
MNEEWLQACSDENGGEDLLGDNDGIETSERREKLNVLKCKRCRDARKKV